MMTRAEFDSLRTRAEMHNIEAQMELAKLYYDGPEIDNYYYDANEDKAFYWYEQAAKSGNSSAQCKVAGMLFRGEGTRRNCEDGFRWYKKAAEAGNDKAQFEVGNCYLEGNGVSKDFESARSWYKKAADQGNRGAKFNLYNLLNNHNRDYRELEDDDYRRQYRDLILTQNYNEPYRMDMVVRRTDNFNEENHGDSFYKSLSPEYWKVRCSSKTQKEWPICRDLIEEATQIMRYIRYLTDTSYPLYGAINLVISEEKKPLPYGNQAINLKAVLKEIDTLLDKIHRDNPMFPERFDEVLSLRRELPIEIRDDLERYSDGEFAGIIERILAIIAGEESDFSWIDWAKRIENYEIEVIVNRITDLHRQSKTYYTSVDVNYYSYPKTIILYSPVLGDPRYSRDEWMCAFARGLFYLYRMDALIQHRGKQNAIVVESLASYFEYYFRRDMIQSHMNYSLHALVNEWLTRDMFWWPYSGALLLKDLHFAQTTKHYFFQREYKSSLGSVRETLNDFYAAYELCWHKKAKKRSVATDERTRYLFDEQVYNYQQLALRIIKEYVKDNPEITTKMLLSIFDSSIQGSHTVEKKEDALMRLSNRSLQNMQKRCFLNEEDIIITLDGECVVSKDWNKNNIQNMVNKAKGLGYGKRIRIVR